MNRQIKTKHGMIDLTKKTAVMGILNVTPDSFSDGGHFNHAEQAVKRALEMEAAGADIIDIGGESTRPGHTPVSESEEIDRVVPVIEKIREVVSIPLSIDTFKSKTAKAALDAGVDMINDVWGAKYDPAIARVAAEYNVPICLMHNGRNEPYQNLMEDIQTELKESIQIASDQGVSQDQIILDPGIGFCKTKQENLDVLRQLDQLQVLGHPLLLGTSRKSVIGHYLDLPVDERDEATAATTSFGITKGVDIVRVHDVLINARVAQMTDLLVRKGD
ncbi:Dihydropteroate synthase [Pelagirhabdus alkalitolerans]|uniref:Dihydropteroate synthase n=1 Tax=Pelagirhabdus alkalitolerans TaxID=1612202 RepID=A0A1G6MFU4_9BACI|nr:dihydropteroate synthase [Pelagirhabdus alkalitolerans]SDC54508.1 Dihydropteroate synthase [Pelagirhabdus alkalitolerans]